MASTLELGSAYDTFGERDNQSAHSIGKGRNVPAVPRARLESTGGWISDAVKSLVVGYSCTIKTVDIEGMGFGGNLATTVSPMVWRWASRPLTPREAYELAFSISAQITRSLDEERRSDFLEVLRDISSDAPFGAVMA